MLRRAKNRHTALRLPAIRRLRIAATISSSVRSGGWQSDPAETPRAAPAARCCRRLALLQRCRSPRNAAPRSPPRWGCSIAFGRLAPRGTGLHLFNQSGTQVDGIGLRHRSLQKTNQCRQTRSLIKRWESSRFEPSEICSKSPRAPSSLSHHPTQGWRARPSAASLSRRGRHRAPRRRVRPRRAVYSPSPDLRR